MKKNIKYLITTLVVLLVLVGALFALQYTTPEVVEEESSESSEELALLTEIIVCDEADFDTIEYTNESGDITIKQTEVKDADGDINFIYNFVGYEDYDLQSTMGLAIKSISNLKARRDLGEVSDLEEYGLTKDMAMPFKVNFEDGTSAEFLVGSAGGQTTGNYILFEGEVYIITFNELFFAPKEKSVVTYYYDATKLDDNGAAVTDLSYINFSGTNFPEEAKIVADKDLLGSRMTAPFVDVSANFTMFNTLLEKLASLQTTEVVKIDASEEDLAKYGLLEPTVAIEFGFNGGDYKLATSKYQEDSKRFILADGRTDIIYSVDASLISSWADKDLSLVRNAIVFMPAIYEVEKWDFTYQGEKNTVNLSRVLNEEKSTEEQPNYDITTIYGGKEVEFESTTALYGPMISVYLLNLDELEYEETPVIESTYTYYSGKTNTITYHKVKDGSGYVALLDGNYTATVRADALDPFFEAYDDYRALLD